MAVRGAEVTGIDLSERPLGVARVAPAGKRQTVDYRKISAEQMAAELPGAFDAVTCLEMRSSTSPIRQASSIPAPVWSNPAARSSSQPSIAIRRLIMLAVIGAEYVPQMLPRARTTAKFIKPSELTCWCKQSGLEPEELTGMTYNPLTWHYAAWSRYR